MSTIQDLEGQLLAQIGRLEGRLEAIVAQLEDVTRHLGIKKGDKPRTFQVQARKTPEAIGGKWKLQSADVVGSPDKPAKSA